MLNNFESFDNSETSARKSALIQERIGLVSTHMYKQFLDYQHANINTNEIFARMIDNLQAIAAKVTIPPARAKAQAEAKRPPPENTPATRPPAE